MNPDDPLGLLTPAEDPLGLLGPRHLPTKLELAKRNASQPHPEDFEPDEATYAQQALGGVASMARDIPGAEAAQAAARSLIRRQSYQEALNDIRSAEDAAPAAVTRGNRVVGATVAAAAMPGNIPGIGTSIVRQGALYGGLNGLLKADPSSGGDRLESAALDAALTATGGKLLQGIGTGARTVAAKSLGKSALLRKALMEAADAVNYGKAAREGDLAATQSLPPAIQAMMNEPDIQPYIAEVQASRTMQGANPAAVIRKAYELMSERQQLLKRQAITSGDRKAGSALEKDDLEAAKRRVLSETDNLMPSFRGAATTHAIAEGERDAFNTAADATKRIVKESSVAGKKLATNSPEALKELIDNMTPAEAKAALQGVLGRAKELPGLTGNPAKLFGGARTLSKGSKITPLLELLDEKAGPAPAWYRPTNASVILRALSLGAAAGR